jgi:hypothetical protein|nr:MAG TPA: hypothetical protein [Caudoviricetes sp.]
MGIPYSQNPLGTRDAPYKRGQTLINVANGGKGKINLLRGVYYIRAQGGGGGGGDNSYFYNGGGGGSGAGFEGYIKILKPVLNIEVTTGGGGAGGNGRNKGGDTVIPYIMRCVGGGGGYNNDPGIGGALELPGLNSTFTIVKSIIQRNGNNGNVPPNDGNHVSGGNSVLTNSGGGKGCAPATAPGAGGGAGYAWNVNGQAGSYGECLIKYSGDYLINV